MEDWLAFTETCSPYLLHDLPWKADEQDIKEMFEKQWSLLRMSTLYFMRFESGQHTLEKILQAQKWLLEYARIAEEVLLPTGRTHVCACMDAWHLTDRDPCSRVSMRSPSAAQSCPVLMLSACIAKCAKLHGHA